MRQLCRTRRKCSSLKAKRVKQRELHKKTRSRTFSHNIQQIIEARGPWMEHVVIARQPVLYCVCVTLGRRTHTAIRSFGEEQQLQILVLRPGNGICFTTASHNRRTLNGVL